MPENIAGTEGFSGGAYEKPSNRDRGDDIFDTLEAFMERMATHSHSGADSQEITLNFTKEFQDLTIGVDLTWTLQGEGIYRAQVALPAPATFDGNMRKFFFRPPAGEWEEFYPETDRIDNNNMYVYSNDNTADLRVVYF